MQRNQGGGRWSEAGNKAGSDVEWEEKRAIQSNTENNYRMKETNNT